MKKIVVAALIIVIVAWAFALYLYLDPLWDRRIHRKAAIVDHLSMVTPNETFIQRTTTILRDAAFSVDYYESSLVTVEFYRRLPTYGYDLIVLRVHSSTHTPETEMNYTGLFTSEPYNESKYFQEQMSLQVGGAAFLPYHEGDPVYFAITSRFVELSMTGSFKNTTILAMGCWTLTYSDLAEAFVRKGARLFFGWSDSVLSYYTDTATTVLLEHLLAQNRSVEQAVAETMSEVGPDPSTESVLLFFPRDAASYTIAPSAIMSSVYGEGILPSCSMVVERKLTPHKLRSSIAKTAMSA